MLRWILLPILLFCTLSVLAAPEGTDLTKKQAEQKSKAIEKSHWDGTNASLGANANTGNTRTATINAGFNALYKNDPWSNTANFAVLWGKADGSVNKEKFTAVDQLNYSFHKENKSFFFMNGDFTADRFSPYSYVFVGAAGYGRDLYRSTKLVLSAQAGPGWRRNEVRENGDPNSNIIIVTQANFKWNVTDKGVFTELFRYDIGAPFDYLQTITAFQNKIIGNLAVQLSFELDYYSKIPPNSTFTQKTDTISAVSLVYNF